MKTIILRLDNSSIYVNGSLRLSYAQSNLPKQCFQFGTECLIYLEAEQVSFNKETGSLKIKVVDYSPSNYAEFNQQPPKYQIKRLEFEKMDWQKFVGMVSSYRINTELKNSFYNIYQTYSSASETEDAELVKQRIRWDIEQLRNKAPNLFFQGPGPFFEEHFQTVVKVKFEEATFGEGQITFKAKIKDFNVIREFAIENRNLKSEFENIKAWFVKKLGKFFIVTVNLKLIDRQIIEATAFSDEISAINEELIEGIKTQRVLMLVKTVRKKDDSKSVFNHDEVFGILDEGEGSNVFDSSANNIIQILVTSGIAKNIRQLEYLSKDKHSLDEKLRFTLKPHFGFLFKVETPTRQFFIWELLNSHATYLWEKETNDANFYLFVEKEISFIKANGREEYRRYYKNLSDKTFKFNIIEHDGADLTEEERFQVWKNKLEASMLDCV
jgi:hypothetical protein